VFESGCIKNRADDLQDYDGKLNFATDAWTSPNHRAIVATTVHLEHEGQPMSMLLDVVEVAQVHDRVPDHSDSNGDVFSPIPA
jgi:hypothetical protein